MVILAVAKATSDRLQIWLHLHSASVVARCCVTRRFAIPTNPSRSLKRYTGIGIFSGCRNERNTMRKSSSWHSPCCRSRFPRGAFAQQQQQRSGTPEEQKACSPRCPAPLPPGDRSGRLHDPAPARSRTAPKLSRGLRPGAEEPRTIGSTYVRSLPPQAVAGLIRRSGGDGPDSIGFGGVFPIWGRDRSCVCGYRGACRHARSNVSQYLDDQRERTAIRQDSPRREFSGRVVDHSSAPPGADPCASTISSAPPTTSPITQRWRPTKSCAISTCSRRNCWARATRQP